MKDMSWTQAAPYKETMYHRTPSESIANNYTPTANEMKMKNLLKIQQSRPHTRATSQPCILLSYFILLVLIFSFVLSV
jgi:dynein heavy chain